MDRLRIVYFGTPWISSSILQFLFDKQVNIIAVVTKPDKPAGRSKQLQSSPVKDLCLKKYPSLPLLQPPKASDPLFADAFLRPLQADLFIVVAYGEIFKENLLHMPPLGCINVHASLLPKYRGAAPIARSIMAGEKESGVTIMSMAPQLDTGEILATEKIPIPPDMTAGELTVALAAAGKEALYRVLQSFSQGKVKGISQDPSLVTYAPKVTTEDGRLEWKKPVDEVYNIFRGVTPKPGAWCEVEIRGVKKRLLVKKARPVDYQGVFGSVLDVPGLVVACSKGALSLLEVQLEGKGAMEASPFLRGFPKITLRFF